MNKDNLRNDLVRDMLGANPTEEDQEVIDRLMNKFETAVTPEETRSIYSFTKLAIQIVLHNRFYQP